MKWPRWLSTFAAAALVAIALAAPTAAVRAETVLTVAVTDNWSTLDPAKTKTGVEYNYNYLVHSGLTEFTHELKLKPDLATRWESNDDLTVWTFYLREDAKFHHGRPVSAADVISTIERILDPATGSVLKVNFEIIDKMEAVDDRTVRFTLKIPYSPFPALFAGYQARILPHDKLDTLTTEPVGSGPFKFVELLPGDRLVLAKNPDHWEADQIHVDRLVIRVIPEFSAAVINLEAGDVDMVWSLPPEEIEKLKTSKVATAHEVATGNWWAFVMNNTHPPFDNVKVRQAFNKLVDKPLFTEIAALGHGTPIHTPIPPSHPYYNHDIPMQSADLEGAAALLKEAGVDPSQIKLDLWTPASLTELQRMSVALREQAQKIGIEINVRPVPDDKFFADIEGKATFHTTLFYDRVIPDVKLYSWFHSTGSWNANEWHFADAEVDEVLDKARRARSEEEEKKHYMRLQELLLEKVPGIFVFTSNHANGASNRIKGFRSSPLMLLDFRGVEIGS